MPYFDSADRKFVIVCTDLSVSRLYSLIFHYVRLNLEFCQFIMLYNYI